MASLRVVNRLVCRGFIVLTLLLMFFNEVLIYYIAQSRWHSIDCQHENCTRVLLIADPQILGNSYDRSSHSPLARYDSDRYLQKSFERAISFTQPHIIVFLGDLLDEGNIATAQEYKQYVKRFKRIFQNKKITKRVHVPGDNDIGGDNGDYISNSNQRRFENEFMSEDLFDYDNHLRFFKINRMLLDFTNPDKDNNADRLRIGVSHAPLLIGGGPLLRAIISDLDPHIIFSGHWHESRIFIYPSTKVINFYENAVRHFDLKALKEQDHSYLEIMVPTCSYRMGKSKIGMGYAVLEDYNLSYTVLWQPNRFILLFTYVFWGLFVLCGGIVYKMMTRCPFRVVKRHTQYSRVSNVPQF
ncbi:metallophosphoesterase 1 [Drosophila albomicans]|uniref:Metallophosphoesterase 1 n=1 Tax=Drosophila albomicans TaxID=7291 RepID=A0A6P8X6S1_DROAB|nr:metallophosphoesterase 1 [Drosophila albomicans]XP_034106971.1 metallophosphoesterase 1 [Drosophila albomicans]XP_051861670.1 metallophosphoesterase 1 [Drosophila albomicans]